MSMKNILSLCLIVVLCPLAVQADTDTKPRLISVTGNAEVRVVPDEVILTLGVETSDEEMSVAKGINDRIIEKIKAAADKHKIDEKYIKTDFLQIEPRYIHEHAKREFIGYFVRKTVVLTLKDLEQFEDVLSDVLQAGATHVHGIEFRTSELRKHRDNARDLAIKAAREKAEALAGALGQKIGRPNNISENHSGWGYGSYWGSRWSNTMAQNVYQNSSGDSTSENALSPGQINVNASVRVSFELES